MPHSSSLTVPPLVWAARWTSQPLPERVAGSDLIFELSAEAARKQSRLFLLGGAKGIADEAARRLCACFPGLQVVGTACPTLQELTEGDEKALIARINATRPDILLVAFGQPKGERRIHRHLHELGVPISIQVGASLDFAAGMIKRAPRWMQKSGLEWAFRLSLEPKRLFWRYTLVTLRSLAVVLSGKFAGWLGAYSAQPYPQIPPHEVCRESIPSLVEKWKRRFLPSSRWTEQRKNRVLARGSSGIFSPGFARGFLGQFGVFLQGEERC